MSFDVVTSPASQNRFMVRRRLLILAGVYAVPAWCISGYLLNYTSEYSGNTFNQEAAYVQRDFVPDLPQKKFSNRELTKIMVIMLREQGVNIKQAARDLDISVARARNWYYKGTGMTALDLLWIMREYEFVRQEVESSLSLEFR